METIKYTQNAEGKGFVIEVGNVKIKCAHPTAQATFEVSEGDGDATLELCRVVHRALGALKRQSEKGAVNVHTATPKAEESAPKAPEQEVLTEGLEAAEDSEEGDQEVLVA